MEHKKLELIKELMDQLSEQMDMSKDDFDERLGKGKKEVKVISMEEDPESEEVDHEEEMFSDLSSLDEEEESEEDKLERRIRSLRS